MTSLLPVSTLGKEDAVQLRQAFRRTVGAFPTGVTVVTTLTPAGPWGMTVSAFISVSLDPLLILVSLAEDSRLSAAIAESGVFAASVLAGSQRGVAERFADRTRPVGPAAFEGFAVFDAPATGCPVLTSSVSAFDCRVYDVHPAGDHHLVLGEVLWFGRYGEEEPLVFVRSGYASLNGSSANGSSANGSSAR